MLYYVIAVSEFNTYMYVYVYIGAFIQYVKVHRNLKYFLFSYCQFHNN